ncbi:MAG: RNA polymerase sigma factor [Oscillibacter sp.]|nr:RNA polymerase sigma factor [Oscillibacter sp.]
MEDGQILDLYWSRDQRAIRETDGKYGKLLHGIAWNLLRSREDSEECVNDTYLRAWEAIPPARPGAFRTWLGRITRNLSLDRWKSRGAEKRGGGAELLLGELEDCLPAPGGTERAVEDRELAELLNVFLQSLTREGRAMFLRRYWYGESVAEVAEALGCGEGKVKSSLFRSRKALRQFLEREGIAV